MSKNAELSAKLRTEVGIIEGIRKTRESGRSSAEHMLDQIARNGGKPQDIKHAFETFCSSYLGVVGASIYKQHIQNLSTNIPALLASQPISPDLQMSINFTQAVFNHSSQKTTEDALKIINRAHKATTTLEIPRCIAFYLNARTQITPPDIASVLLEVAEAKGWTLEWLQQVLAPFPQYSRIVTETLQNQQGFGQPAPVVCHPAGNPPAPAPIGRPTAAAPAGRPTAAPIGRPTVAVTIVEPQVSELPGPVQRPTFGRLQYETPGVFSRETADITEDIIH
jgi:hypothetical protein